MQKPKWEKHQSIKQIERNCLGNEEAEWLNSREGGDKEKNNNNEISPAPRQQ